MDGERIERALERGRVHSEATEELLQLLRGVERVAVHVDLSEERVMHLRALAERLSRIEATRVQAHQWVPHRRHSHEVHVVGFASLPALKVRVEGVAMRAAVPKDLGHLHLGWARARRLSWRESLIVSAELKTRGDYGCATALGGLRRQCVRCVRSRDRRVFVTLVEGLDGRRLQLSRDRLHAGLLRIATTDEHEGEC